MDNEEKVPPVKEGEIVEVEIINIGKAGDGVGKIDGFIIFVPETEKGDMVEVKITKVMDRMAFAELIEKK